MTRQQLLDAKRRAPFQPFSIHLADGRSLFVPHTDFLSVSPTDRTVIVYGEKGGFTIVDALLVTAIETNPPAAASA
jgi:hypothetical protein